MLTALMPFLLALLKTNNGIYLYGSDILGTDEVVALSHSICINITSLMTPHFGNQAVS